MTQSRDPNSRRNAKIAAKEQAEQNQKITRYTIIGVGALLVLLLAAWGFNALMGNKGSEGTASGGTGSDGTASESDRGLASMDPAKRNGYYQLYPKMVIDSSKNYEAVVRTEQGDMTFKLYANLTPKTVNNFVFLANEGYYDNTMFHRVLANFMAQGGDPTGTGTGGPGYNFEDEIVPDLQFNKRGLLAMANAGPATNGSQFFITFAPTTHLDGKHTIFGELIQGDDVLGKIKLREPRTASGPGDLIKRIDIYEK